MAVDICPFGVTTVFCCSGYCLRFVLLTFVFESAYSPGYSNDWDAAEAGEPPQVPVGPASAPVENGAEEDADESREESQQEEGQRHTEP